MDETQREAEIQRVKAQFTRKASRAVLDGTRPPEDPYASSFGRVWLTLPGETWPRSNGKPMLPLAQFNLAEMPYCPENLSDIALITVFIDQDELPTDTLNGDGWLLRAYSSLEGLVLIQDHPPVSPINPCSIEWELIAEDYPSSDDASNLGISDLMNEHEDEGYAELFATQQGTKIGGWPFGVQCEVLWPLAVRATATPEYAFQIDTEQEARWMWGDVGFGYFGRGAGDHRDVWAMEWQCY